MPVVSAPIARWRIAAAFVLAPLVGSFAFACWEPAYLGLDSLIERVLRTTSIVALVGGYPAALIFGLPAFLVLRTRVRPSILNCTVSGAIVAALPWLLVAFVFPDPQSAYAGGHVTVEDGAKTWWGWLEMLSIVGEAAVFGALTGAAFWLIAVPRPVRRG